MVYESKHEQLTHILADIKGNCINSPMPIVCDKAECTDCLVKHEAMQQFRNRRPLMIWAESGRRVLQPVSDFQKDSDSMGYLTADEGNPFGSTEGL